MNYFIITTITGLIIELISFILWTNNINSLFVWTLHILAAAFIIYGLYYRNRHRSGKDGLQGLYIYCLLLVVFIPWIGIFFSCLLILIVRSTDKESSGGLFEEYSTYLAEKPEKDIWIRSSLSMMREVRDNISFESYIDILNSDKVKIKAIVIQKLAKHETIKNIKLLKMALKDKSPEVRLYAVGALLKIESRLNEKIRKTTKVIEYSPSARAYAELGYLYRLYADANLIGKALVKYYINLSANAYRSSLDINTNQPKVIDQYCRNLIELEEYAKVESFIKHAMKIWPHNTNIVFLCNEVYFQLKKYKGIVNRFSSLNINELDDFQKKVYSTWLK